MLATSKLLLTLLLGLPGVPPAEDLAEHAQRRERLTQALHEGSVGLVFAGRGERRSAPDFFWLTGLDAPGAALLLRRGSQGSEVTLYLERRDRSQEFWTGPRVGPGDVEAGSQKPDAERLRSSELTGIERIRPLSALEGQLARHLRRGRTLALVLPQAAEAWDESARALLAALERRHPELDVEPLSPLIEPLRLRKSALEVERITRAVELTAAAQRLLASRIVAGQREYELEAAAGYLFRVCGGSGAAFPTIVGSGSNANVLHWTHNDGRLEAGALVLVDMGARVDGYAADLTRTWPVSGRFDERQRELYELVLAARAAALEQVRPGSSLAEVHAAAKQVFGGAGFEDQPPHRTSHFLGLEVHDVGDQDQPLEPGMVLTVEPGIYLTDEETGIRVEDVVLVTAEGHRVLSVGLPVEAEPIEALMAAPAAALKGCPAGE